MLKEDGAFLTIGEVARELGVAQHILRYWESRFPQLRPLQRSGNRRYYRPGDVEIARRINQLLNAEGYTVQGAQRLLSVHKVSESSRASATAQSKPVAKSEAADRQPEAPVDALPKRAIKEVSNPSTQVTPSEVSVLLARLMVIRQNLDDALHSG